MGTEAEGAATVHGGGRSHQLVVFCLAQEEYGVPITLVQEIIPDTPPRPIPGSPSHVEGVINLRGPPRPDAGHGRAARRPALAA
jgi:chemotaxis signal transduction protein